MFLAIIFKISQTARRPGLRHNVAIANNVYLESKELFLVILLFLQCPANTTCQTPSINHKKSRYYTLYSDLLDNVSAERLGWDIAKIS